MNTNLNTTLNKPTLPKALRALALLLPLLGMLSMIVVTRAGATAPLLRDLETQAIRQVAERNGLAPNELSVINSAKANYPLQGKTTYDYKISDKHAGAIYGVALDATGKEVDTAKIRADEEAAYTDKYGKLEPELADLLPGASANQAIRVAIWLKEPQYTPPQQPAENMLASEAQVDAFYAQVDAQRAAAVQNVVAPVASKMAKLGYATKSDLYAPLLYVSLTPSEIKELNGWSEIDRVYLPRTYEPAVDSGRYTIKANVVQGFGYTGVGVKMGAIEVGGRVVSLSGIVNPNLSGITQDQTDVCAYSNSYTDWHAVAVAGIIRSSGVTNPAIRGIAPGALLRVGGSCFGVDSELQAASVRAINWGARVLNLSFSTSSGATHPGLMSRYYDGIVSSNLRTVVVAAGDKGNKPNPADRLLTDPALLYSGIAMGSFNDGHTSNWTGDTMSSFSSYVDPTTLHGDRHMPDVVAPGSNINSTTTSSPWTGPIGSGTSLSSPMAASAAALLIQHKPFLATQPQRLKAILMATAIHNIEGNQRVSDKDGVGGIAIDGADELILGTPSSISNFGNSGSLTFSSSDPYYSTVTTMNLTAGVRTRAVLAWDGGPNYPNYANEPPADQDLAINDSNGNRVAADGTYDNGYEIVDFVPLVSGTYTMERTNFRPGTGGHFGWAWYKCN